MTNCAIKSCKNDSRKQSKQKTNITFHRFPKNAILKQKWTAALKRPGWEPNIGSHICSVHFKNSSFYETKSGLRRLVENAVPSLLLYSTDSTNNENIIVPASTSLNSIDPLDLAHDCRNNSFETNLKESKKEKHLRNRVIELTEIARRRRLRCNSLHMSRNRLKKKLDKLSGILAELGGKRIIFEDQDVLEDKFEDHKMLKEKFEEQDILEICSLPISKNSKRIGTHDGVFHCDEVLACFMLKQLPEYKDAEIIRTRDKSKLAECDIVVDVGAVFDHSAKRYDHHQREFTDTLSTLRPELGDKYKIKLSSAGLIYTYYGEKVLEALTNSKINQENIKILFKKVYENFVEEIDAIDNGIPMTESEPLYRIRTHLSSRVGKLNPEWNTNQTIDIDKLFAKAIVMVGEEFSQTLHFFASAWLPARDCVRDALDQRFKIHISGEILEFTERYPWKEHLFDLETDLGIPNEVKFVIFNDKPESWRVQAVPIAPSSFALRKPLNSKWWGVRDEILSEVSGIPGCIFCHSNGFIGGNVTREGALKMAIASLEA